MRRFHNWVKEHVLCEEVKRLRRVVKIGTGGGTTPLTLLDYGCGFGGDLAKWVRAGIPHAIGVDPSEEAVREALRRHDNTQLPSSYPHTYCFLHEKEPVRWLKTLPDDCLDMVTCHFAIHYYDRTGQKELLQEVYRVLSPRGALMLSFMDGRKIMCHRNDGVSADLLQLRMISPTRVQVRLRDSVYFDSIGGVSEENLTFAKYLETEAAAIQFSSVSTISFDQLYLRRDNPLRGKLSQKEREVSSLHVAMVLRK